MIDGGNRLLSLTGRVNGLGSALRSAVHPLLADLNRWVPPSSPECGRASGKGGQRLKPTSVPRIWERGKSVKPGVCHAWRRQAPVAGCESGIAGANQPGIITVCEVARG